MWDSYSSGTFRYGPMHAISLVGTRQEECGDFFAELLGRLETCPLLGPLMPWGDWSSLRSSDPRDSNDGPILWIRPGEQLIRTDQMSARPVASHSRRMSSRLERELLGLGVGMGVGLGPASAAGSLSTRQTDRREILFEDRTPAHADHVDDGLERRTTAAVGLLKAVRCAERYASLLRIASE